MLSLSSEQPFSIGGRRAIYVHPEDPGRCVKLLLPDKQPAAIRKSVPLSRRLFRHAAHYDENLQDLRGYRELAKLHGIQVNRHLPVVFGLVETDLGPGLVVELVRDDDGQISLSGKGYVFAKGVTSEMRSALASLESFLITFCISFRDPFLHNLSFQQSADGAIRVFVVDGLARKSWLPPSLVPSKWMRRRIHQQMRRLWRGIERTENNRITGVVPKEKGLLHHR